MTVKFFRSLRKEHKEGVKTRGKGLHSEGEELERKERLRRIKIIKEHFFAEPAQTTMEMYLSWPKEKFDRKFQRMRRGERKRAQELLTSQLQRVVREPLYRMVELMGTRYYAYREGWKNAWGERSFKAIYAARNALDSRNPGWSAPRLNTFLAGVSSFMELLLLICAGPG